MIERSHPWSLFIIVSAAAFAAACAPAAHAAAPAPDVPAAHAHDSAHAPGLHLNQGRKWATDVALREGMTNIRALVAPAVHGTMGKAEYAALASRVEMEVGNIVANCKLAPEADAVLHVVISEVTGGADTMAGRSPGTPPSKGLLQVAAAVNDYGRYFDHPGWKAIRIH
jgi:hypothetical protein